MTKARLIEIIELLITILKEAVLNEEQQATLDTICKEMGIETNE